MRKIKLLNRILKTTGMNKILMGFVIFDLFCAIIFFLVEPEITNYFDAIWYSFVSFTTIGFGDFVVTTTIGKILTMILTTYGVLIVAIIPGILVSYYQEMLRIKAKESVDSFLEDLEDLPNLSKEELAEISQKISQRRYEM